MTEKKEISDRLGQKEEQKQNRKTNGRVKKTEWKRGLEDTFM